MIPTVFVETLIISFNHATQIQKKLAPSKWKSSSWKDATGFSEGGFVTMSAR